MSTQDESQVTSALQRYEGTPNKRGRRGEEKRWNAFLGWLASWFKKGDDLAEDYAHAKVSEAQAEAEMKRERAAEIAARTDLLKNKNVEKFCDIIDEQFADADPNLAWNLKLAKLLESNPGIAAQVEKVLMMRERLGREKGVRIEPVSDLDTLPPPDAHGADNDHG